jgi:hypothetical protein
MATESLTAPKRVSNVSLPTYAVDQNARVKSFVEAEFKGTDPFFNKATAVWADETGFLRWNRMYPYELLILSEDGNGNWKTHSKFVLPIPPQELTIQAPFAITNTLTMGGVVEEHNGIPTRIIQLQGTMGVNPLRGIVEPMGSKGEYPGLFGGVIQSAQEVAKAYSDTVALASGKGPATAEPISMTSTQLKGTGYYQFRLLQAFLESYAAMKKQADHKDKRLGFAIWKDQHVYLVSPIAFVARRAASSPLEYNYDLQFKAFRRIPSAGVTTVSNKVIDYGKNLSLMSRILGTLAGAYNVIQKLRKTIRALRQDIQEVMNMVREAILFVKQIVGAVIELVHLPQALIKDFKATILKSWDELAASFSELSFESNQTAKALGIGRSTGQGVANSLIDGNANSNAKVVASILDDVFENPDDYADLLGKIDISNLQISEGLQQKVDAELERTSKLTSADLLRMRDTTLKLMANLGNALGAGDATYDATYQSTEPQANRIPTLDDFALLASLNDVADSFANISVQPTNEMSTVDYIAGYASAAGIAFQNPVSKYAVPMPYDTTLEQLAKVYLGDPNRWLEIAALNGLREPYIDEVGFTRMLSSTGSNSNVFVSDVTNLRISQPVWIQSDYVKREKRHILNIVQISSTNYQVTLDGAPDLAKYTSADNAYIRAFLPDTVNSLQVVYIPSDKPGITEEEINVPGVNVFDDLLQVSGIDILLTNNNDLAITPDGDLRFSYGMANIIQQIRLSLGTPKGVLLQHPEWGFPIKVGQSIADTSAQQIASDINGMFVGDPMFERLNSVAIAVTGPAVDVRMNLEVQGMNRPLDVAVRVLR